MITINDVEVGNLYSKEKFEKFDVIGFTANSMVKKDGRLVMGAGNAMIVKDLFKDIDKDFGVMVLGSEFGTLVVERTGPFDNVNIIKIMAFQSKVKFYEKSTIELILASSKSLEEYMDANPKEQIAMPIPGVGLGGLKSKGVLKILPKRENLTWFSFRKLY